MKIIACTLLGSFLAVPVFAELTSANQTQIEIVPAYSVHSESGASYPQMALRHGVSGEVLVAYNINANGQAEDIDVIESHPKAYFVGSTVRALENSAFTASLHEDASAEQRVQKRFIYVMDNKPEKW